MWHSYAIKRSKKMKAEMIALKEKYDSILMLVKERL